MDEVQQGHFSKSTLFLVDSSRLAGLSQSFRKKPLCLVKLSQQRQYARSQVGVARTAPQATQSFRQPALSLP